MEKMTRKEFLKKLFMMYPSTFTTGADGNGKIWREAYEDVLSSKLDFDALFSKMVHSYPHTHIAPAPAYFKDFIEAVEPKKENKNAKHIESLKIGAIPPTQVFLEAKKNLEQKAGDNSKKFQVYGGKYN